MDDLSQTLNVIFPFVVVLVRVVGIIMLTPVLGHSAVPMKVKVGLSLLIAFAVYPVSGVSDARFPGGFLTSALIVMKEVIIGVTIGYAAMLSFTAFEIAGRFIGAQMALRESNLLDPMFEGQSSVIGQIITITALLIFLAVDGHHWFILAIAVSYDTMPVATFSFSGRVMETLLTMFAGAFVTGVKIAAPVIGVLLVMIIAVAVMARIAPQINILMLSIPLRMAVGCVVLAYSLPFILRAINNVIGSLQREVLALLSRT